MDRQQHLKCEITDGLLVISIGIETLCFAAKNAPYLQDEVIVTDEDGFAREILAELKGESGDNGLTPIQRVLDDCTADAIHAGSEHAHYTTEGVELETASGT